MRWHEWRGTLDGRPTMWVRNLGAALQCRLDLHKFVGADPWGCFHTHPAVAIRVVLWGGYVEEMEDGTRKTWRPGRIGIVRPELSHRVAVLLNGRSSYSLWIRGPRCARIQLRGSGWAWGRR